MSKVSLSHSVVKESFPIAKATIATGWLPGQGFKLNTTGDYAEIGSVDNVMFIGIDDDTEVKNPPSASLLTGVYGAGTTMTIDHSAEVAAGSSVRAYAANVESAAVNQLLYMDTDGKWSTVASGSVKGQLFQVPSAANNYSLGLIMRF